MPLSSKTGPEDLQAALSHLDQAIKSGSIAAGAAKGLLYSVMETLGVLVGDPALPDQLRDGYEGLLESARELRARLDLPHAPPR